MAPMIDGAGSAASLRFAVIRSRFNETVTKHLLEGTLEALRGAGAKNEAIDVVSVPGAFEIPLIAAQLAKSQRYDALVCLGAVIRGETAHFEYISMAVSQGIARVAYDYEVPVIFGVLTTDTEEQAEARATPSRKGRAHKSPGRTSNKSRVWTGAEDRCNKGYEAGRAAIEMANLMKRLDSVRAELDIVRGEPNIVCGEPNIVCGEPVEPPPRDRSSRFPGPTRRRKRL